MNPLNVPVPPTSASALILPGSELSTSTPVVPATSTAGPTPPPPPPGPPPPPPPPPSTDVNAAPSKLGLFAELLSGSRKLKKRSDVDLEDGARDTGTGPFKVKDPKKIDQGVLQEQINNKILARKKDVDFSLLENKQVLGETSHGLVLDELLSRAAKRKPIDSDKLDEISRPLSPPPVRTSAPLTSEIQLVRLKENKSMFKQAEPSRMAAPMVTVVPVVPSNPPKSQARVQKVQDVGPDGKPLADWKKKILQQKLDQEFEKERLVLQEAEMKEAKWVNVPEWKRTMLEKKEAEVKRPAPLPERNEDVTLGQGLLRKRDAPPPTSYAPPPTSYAPPPTSYAPPPPAPDVYVHPMLLAAQSQAAKNNRTPATVLAPAVTGAPLARVTTSATVVDPTV